MEKYIYNNLQNYKGMDIEMSPLYSKINVDINILTEYEYFKLFISEEIVEILVKESNNFMNAFLKNKFGENFKDVILNQKNYNAYPYIYVIKGIHKEDIFAFIAIRLFWEFISTHLLIIIVKITLYINALFQK